nr:mannonate dehydratase [uncultured Clostridium sp.]
MIKIQANATSKMAEEQMQSVRGMGISYLAVNFLTEDADYDSVMRFQERAAKYDLKIADAGCPALQKCPQIHLGKEDRNIWIDKYNDFTRALGRAGVKVNYLAWQPNGIFRSRIAAGLYTRGEHSMICDMDEIMARPIANDREYSEQEIWDNFRYFLDRALPVCEEADVKLALHPNDPPVCSLGGVHSLIWNSQRFDRAFEAAGESPYLGMKMCIGCWLEDRAFGNLKNDIRRFTQREKILVVHFRNVSGTIPYFEETLLEDGYGDMNGILDELILNGYDGQINIDHPFFLPEGKGPSPVSEAYMMGYLKGMLHSAYKSHK